MTFIEIKTAPTGKGRVLVLRCDSCNNSFQRKYTSTVAESAVHACSAGCRSKLTAKGGVLYERRLKRLRATSLARYGVEYAIASDDVREKSRATMIKHYGVDNPSKSAEICEKRRQTFLSRYGVDSPRKIEGMSLRIRQTCLERYGVDNPMKSPEVFRRYYERAQSAAAASKRRTTSLKNFGVEQPLSSPIVREKARLTCIERYGDEHPMRTDVIKERRRQAYMRSLGVEHPSQVADVRRKAHETMKRNGTYARSSSTAEDRFNDLLVSIFDVENIRRHVEVNGWCIDFHIVPYDLYIQFDGVYWHGLDRPIEVIREFKNPRDVTINDTWLRDRRQNEWFDENDLILLRVTDRDDHEQMMYELIREVEGFDGEEG